MTYDFPCLERNILVILIKKDHHIDDVKILLNMIPLKRYIFSFYIVR